MLYNQKLLEHIAHCWASRGIYWKMISYSFDVLLFFKVIKIGLNMYQPIKMFHSIISLVVKYLPSKQMSRVRFPDDANLLLLSPFGLPISFCQFSFRKKAERQRLSLRMMLCTSFWDGIPCLYFFIPVHQIFIYMKQQQNLLVGGKK